jgi:hypothetical protein
LCSRASALDDIRASIRELEFYRQHMCISLDTPAPAPAAPGAEDGADAAGAAAEAEVEGESEAARMAEKIGQA